MHRLRGALPILLVAAGLVGCSSSSSTTGKQTGAAGSTASAASGGATSAGGGAADFTRKDMIVTAACAETADGATIEVTGWDAKSWSQVAHATFPLSAKVQVRHGGNALAELCHNKTNDELPVAGSEAGIRAMFDRDYTRMAVQIGNDDGVSHIGYVDRSGNVTDLTGDSFSTTPQEANAAFAADGSAVWFTYPGTAEHETRLASRSVTGDHKLVDAWHGNAATEPFVVPPPSGKGPVAVGRDVFFSPDGARLVANQSVFDVSSAGPVVGPDDKGSNPQAGGSCATEFAGWTGPTTVLCEGEDNGTNFKIRDLAASTSSPNLLPTTDHIDDNLLISPDGGRCLFKSISGSQAEFYVSQTSPSGTPSKVTGPDSSVPGGRNPVFLEWR